VSFLGLAVVACSASPDAPRDEVSGSTAADLTTASVQWDAPAANATVHGWTTLRVLASGVQSVWFDAYYADEPTDITTVSWHHLGQATQTAPGTWELSWNTYVVADQGNAGWGTVNLFVGATDLEGHTIASDPSSYRRVNVHNATVVWQWPAANTTVSGHTTLQVYAPYVRRLGFDAYYATRPSDPATLAWHHLGDCTPAPLNATCNFVWDTTAIPNQGSAGWGTVNVAAIAEDIHGNRLWDTPAAYRRFDVIN
jgi:hypothetical protein